MKHTFWIQAQHSYTATETDGIDLRRYLKQHGREARRMSRFSQLVSAGTLPFNPSAESNIYLASPFSSPSKFTDTFSRLLNDNLPSPLDFMAALNNAATFQTAQTLGCDGPSVFLLVSPHTYWQPLWLAVNDLLLHPRQTALVGWAYERIRADETQPEGSFWWQIGTTAGSNPSAEIIVDMQSKHFEEDAAESAEKSGFLQPVSQVFDVLARKGQVILPCAGYPQNVRITVKTV
ncbi:MULTISPECIES: hypothetical protein [unclassified Neisseria]|uniref:hypothetical protein n=1 Tax=unclassified Neisseria TaxID=2623750 RepID=UPI002666E52B|nr:MULTISPECIES: hypothetical protein [unclassified Neisseria]MDO1508880.1 hypothetical protein [Neisseria sp. MVDL19-042950]MDO1515139.1 hypothetical protein [Neisseria sp. MVDL18-041461]MDO1562499.1 hypothetical protein [Neisseria sp. MVDL20-010259]